MRSNMLECLSDNIVVDRDKCIFCGQCIDRCILDNLRMKLAACSHACPLDLNCQGYVQLIARGEEARAMEVIRERLPFPGILGRICSQPCEDHCARRDTDGEAVSIRVLKRYLDDRFKDLEPSLPEMKTDSGKKVAVIGAGPAGLMAAYDLAVQGHRVSVYERESDPGGLLRWGIPVFRLPQDVLERELTLLERMGIEFQCGIAVGKDKTLSELQAEFDAVLIAAGLPECQKLNISGENENGVFHGLPFLKSVRNNEPPSLGEKVLVIGGGNAAVDVAQTAIRLGAGTVRLVSLECREDMPAFNRAILDAVSENVALACSWGNPRLEFENGTLKGVHFQACTAVFDEEGRFHPVFEASETRFMEADTVIIAIGQRMDTGLGDASTFELSLLSQVDPVTLQTAEEKIFAAGDIVSGPSSVVTAMAGGKAAAESINRYLSGLPLAYGRLFKEPVVSEFEVDRCIGGPDQRMRPSQHRFKEKGDFSELETGVSEADARREARRCHSCGLPFGQFRTCWFCLPCEVVCPTDAIWVDIPYLMR